MSGIAGGSNVMRQQKRISLSVKELDDIVMADDSSTTGLRESLCGNNNPVVVLIFMGVTRNLLALAANPPVGVITWVALRVRMQQVLGVHMFDGNGVEVTNFCGPKTINADR